MENRDEDIKQEVIWRDASASEHESILKWSKSASREKTASVLVRVSIPVFFAAFLDIFLLLADEDVGRLIAATVVIAIALYAFAWFLLAGVRASKKAIQNGEYTVTDAVVIDKEYFSGRNVSYHSLKVRYAGDKTEKIKIYTSREYDMYNKSELGTHVLLINYGEDLGGFYSEYYDCIMVELFEKKEETHEG